MADFDSIESQLNALDAKVDALEVKVEAEKPISRICTDCGGAGYLYDTALGGTPETLCPLCEGFETIDWGFQEAL